MGCYIIECDIITLSVVRNLSTHCAAPASAPHPQLRLPLPFPATLLVTINIRRAYFVPNRSQYLSLNFETRG